jgi:hypothetical protein
VNYQEEYRAKLTTADEAAKIVRSGDWVEYGAFSGQVIELDKALARRKAELLDVTRRGTSRMGTPAVGEADPDNEHFTYNSTHLGAAERAMGDRNLCWYLPVLYHEQPDYYRKHIRTDVVFLTVHPMDEWGYFNFGPQVSHAMAVCETADRIVLEVNPNVPKCLGGFQESIHISRVTKVIEADWKLPELPPIVPSETDRKIAALIMERLEDDAVCCFTERHGVRNLRAEVEVSPFVHRMYREDYDVRTDVLSVIVRLLVIQHGQIPTQVPVAHRPLRRPEMRTVIRKVLVIRVGFDDGGRTHPRRSAYLHVMKFIPSAGERLVQFDHLSRKSPVLHPVAGFDDLGRLIGRRKLRPVFFLIVHE